MGARAASWVIALAAASLATAGENAGSPIAADGCIHGTVTTYAGRRHTGLIRWGGQEAFWDDIFHSAKVDLPYRSYAPADEPEDQDALWWQILGRKLVGAVEGERFSRVFAARFGDIASIDVTGAGEAVVAMRSGSTYRVRGYSNDVGATLEVVEADGRAVEIEWQRIDTVELSAAPAGTTAPASRLYGTVATTAGQFAGFIQWDEDECLATDRLDGDTDDGRISIPFAAIVAIEPRSSSGASVVLDDGRELLLRGTNDVNLHNRGIFVEDPRYGRVKVPWVVLRRVELSAAESSGAGLRELAAPAPLRGTVTTTDGSTVNGRLHVDLDESESWELLDGVRDGVEYLVPFGRVRSLVRTPAGAAVVLTSGVELALEGGDVGERNAGVVVELAGNGERFIPWREVRRIDLDGAVGP